MQRVYMSLLSLLPSPLGRKSVNFVITTLSGDKWRSLYLAYCLSVLLQLYKYAAIRFFTAPSGTTVKSFTTVLGWNKSTTHY